MTKKKNKKKKLKPRSDDNLYFLHEDNRDLWEGRSKQFANPGEVMNRIYGVNPFESRTGCHKFVLTVPVAIFFIILFFNGLGQIQHDIMSLNMSFVVFMCLILLLNIYLVVKLILYFEQMRLESKYHPDDDELARALSDVVRHGEYVTGYVEKIRNYHDIHFYYHDDAGNRQDATYTYDKKHLVSELRSGSRLALIQYNDRFVAL